MMLEDEDSCSGPMSLESELGLIDRLLTLAKSCRSRALKSLVPELKAEKRRLTFEMEARAERDGDD
jgi:hypothetical protein